MTAEEKEIITNEEFPFITIGSVSMSKEVGGLFSALAKAQTRLKHPSKDKTAKIPTKAGRDYEYKYADLPSLIDATKALAEEGISVIQAPTCDGQVAYVTTMLGWGGKESKEGQWISSKLAMGLADNRPQTVGSAITYIRRYALSAMVNVAAEEDDDGKIASEKKEPKDSGEQKPHKYKPDQLIQPEGSGKEKKSVIYTGTAAQKNEVKEALAASKAPEEVYQYVHAQMIGKPLSDLDRVIQEIREGAN